MLKISRPHLSTDPLTRMEQANRRFRVGLSVLTVAVFIAVLGIGALGYYSFVHNQKANEAILHRLEQNDKDTGVKLQDLQSHIDCLFKLATTPGHSELQITDLVGCKLKASDTAASDPSGSNPLFGTPSSTKASPHSAAPAASPAATPSQAAQGQSGSTTCPQGFTGKPPDCRQAPPHPALCAVTLSLLGCGKVVL